MPARQDIKSILIIGSGPIVIGQACEFDYSGAQACKVLKNLGYKIILHNSNPATIMTDPGMADRTYIEPLDVQTAIKIIEKENPDCILPTVGGQTALNLAMELHRLGVLQKYNVELIGAQPQAIDVAEDRQKFKLAMNESGIPVPPSGIATNLEEAEDLIEKVGLPAIIRPSFTLGGEGGGVAYTLSEFKNIVSVGLELSPINQILIEKSVLGWKEFELEIIRDKSDNTIMICSIENIDAMGVHTGDSITVAPAQTLTDVELQKMRSMAFEVIRKVGVETGGSNVQFAVSPEDGEMLVIEMNPRVSRSSALASKATGFPIAKIAAQLAIGLTLDEIKNDITLKTPACFEPALDYVVVKIPRWNTEKFNGACDILSTQMKAVGEVMAIGGTFQESFFKAVESLEIKPLDLSLKTDDEIFELLKIPTDKRIWALLEAFKRSFTVERIAGLTDIDPWFISQLKNRNLNNDYDLVYKCVDTCAAEFESYTPYYYSTFGIENEIKDDERESIIVIGNGPNRIGQGLEFDYCCVHAAEEIKNQGYKAVMINCNPETVSTDYDTSDSLYFEPITKHYVNEIIKQENPKGVLLQFGGQTPLKLASSIENVMGTHHSAIDICEDREKFNSLVKDINGKQPPGRTALNLSQAWEIKEELGLPLLVRPSYVLGGKCMNICWTDEEFENAAIKALEVSDGKPLLVDKYLDYAAEYDLDLVSDGESVCIAAIMEHIEEAGIHSGDSSCVIPTINLSQKIKSKMEKWSTSIAIKLNVIGLMNIQFAVKDDELYILEVNPRASRTIPYVSKATGIPWVKIATKLALGESLSQVMANYNRSNSPGKYFVKSPVFPWRRFTVNDTLLGPEMKSTGEVMGVDVQFEGAYEKALRASGIDLSFCSRVLLSISDKDKKLLNSCLEEIKSLESNLLCTSGTYFYLKENGIDTKPVAKFAEGRSTAIKLIREGKIDLVMNTPSGASANSDESSLRQAALRSNIPCITSINSILAVIKVLQQKRNFEVYCLQDYTKES